MTPDSKTLLVVIPDTRGVEVSPYGGGNMKLGLGVRTYSRLPGHPSRKALGGGSYYEDRGTCPGATAECQAICYAARPVAEAGPVRDMWELNSMSESVPPIPDDCKLLRIHVSGDFTTVNYIDGWIVRLKERPDVTAWAYTRSWRVPELLPALERLRVLPNIQLFASMDSSTKDLPPTGWRRAWIDGDHRGNKFGHDASIRNTFDDSRTYVCPEETGDKPNCEECGYCFRGKRNDVTFLKH